MIPAEITSILMSDYFTGHPQYYLTYSIFVQALYGEELNPSNSSNIITASELNLYVCMTVEWESFGEKILMISKMFSLYLELIYCSIFGSIINQLRKVRIGVWL